MKTCDHRAVGILAWSEDRKKLLIIQRREPSHGYAAPAGHLDGKSYPVACAKELWEETGLKIAGAPKPVFLRDGGYRSNKCGRENGNYHLWQIFEINWQGQLQSSSEETLGVGWLTIPQIELLAERTEKYLRGELNEDNWIICPGLEPIWYEFFKELKII